MLTGASYSTGHRTNIQLLILQHPEVPTEFEKSPFWPHCARLRAEQQVSLAGNSCLLHILRAAALSFFQRKPSLCSSLPQGPKGARESLALPPVNRFFRVPYAFQQKLEIGGSWRCDSSRFSIALAHRRVPAKIVARVAQGTCSIKSQVVWWLPLATLYLPSKWEAGALYIFNTLGVKLWG